MDPRTSDETEPVTELCGAFSSPGAAPVPWARGRDELRDAEIYWLSTVRPDGRPHVTPLLGVWLRGAFYFSTGAAERKAKNLATNANCVVTTGVNMLSGHDVVLEGSSAVVHDEGALNEVADTFEAKYGDHFTAPDGTWAGLGDAIRSGQTPVFRVAPVTAFGFAKSDPFSQTRWRF